MIDQRHIRGGGSPTASSPGSPGSGNGGQPPFISLNLVVVTMAGNCNAPDRGKLPAFVLGKIVLPAVSAK